MTSRSVFGIWNTFVVSLSISENRRPVTLPGVCSFGVLQEELEFPVSVTYTLHRGYEVQVGSELCHSTIRSLGSG